jgi:hypothetical protein
MGIAVKINQDLYESARVVSKKEHRTITGQIEFWIKVGRTAIDNPDLPASFIAEVLTSLSKSTPVEQSQYRFEELLAQWNLEARPSEEGDEWLNMRPVGKEIL